MAEHRIRIAEVAGSTPAGSKKNRTPRRCVGEVGGSIPLRSKNMKNIVIPRPNNDSLVAQLGSLYNTFKGVVFGEKLEFDLSLLDWVCPLLILPISAYINDTQSEFRIDNCSIKSYLSRINFPNGVSSVSSFQRLKTFIPISVLTRGGGVDRERLVSLPNFYWKGSIIAYRIPKPTGSIDIYKYLE